MKKGLKTIRSNAGSLLLGAAAAAVLAASGTALAKDYPTKPVSWIVTWPAGGGADTATRTFTKYLEKEIDGTIVINNVVGGGASIGYMTAKQARPDGYTLLTAQGDLPKFAPTKLAPIDIKDFDFIAGFAVQSPVLIVRADSPWKTLKDFVEDAKKIQASGPSACRILAASITSRSFFGRSRRESTSVPLPMTARRK